MTSVRERTPVADRPCVDYLGQSARLPLSRLSVPRQVAFWLVAYVFGVTILGTAVPAPLYTLWQRQWHFNSAVVTLIFAVYAVAVLAVLLLAGRASDQAGRKPVMAAALGCSAVSTALFILATNVGWLFAGRFFSGLSAGLMIGAATAALTQLLQESDSRRASLVASTANMGGAGLGPLMAGLFAQYLPDPTVLVFEVYLGLLAIALLLLAFVPEPVTHKQRPTLRFDGLGIPPQGRAEFVAAGMAAFSAFALTGLFTSLAPAFVSRVMHQTNLALGGAVAFLLFAVACVTALGLARFNSRPVIMAGLGLFLVALALIVAGMGASSVGLFLGGAAVGGAAVGAVNMASLSMANRLAPADERGRVLSSYYVFAYTGLIIPVVGVGFAADAFGDFRATLGCAIGLAALCAGSAVLITGRAPRRAAVRGGRHAERRPV
ncbi:MAG TPA: MFS transporter [Streptosporangiaceae bacterium]|jgi:MFS family permease|nr:MFS transporter [Streptosporangiaceae bacterium]